MVDNEISLWANLDLKDHATRLNDEMEINEVKLPRLYNSLHPKFMSKPHLYSIYYDSYRCILYGLYHPGIMLLGQLIEVTINEIIFVHDNVRMQGPLAHSIKYSEDTTGKRRKCSTTPLFPKFVINFLKRVQEFRDPYIHLNYTKLFKNDKIKIARFSVGKTYQENFQKLESVLTKSSVGEVSYFEINPAFDNSVADITKRNNEPAWARDWAWDIYPFFEFLIDEYLTFEDYQKHVKLYGTKFDTIPLMDDKI